MADTATVEQVNSTGTVETQVRTFTQDEVNAIVKGRLEKESAKYADYEELQKKASELDEIKEANKSELQKATEKAEDLEKQLEEMRKEKELRDIREKVSTETGVPADLLTCYSEEECLAQANKLLAFKNERTGYPVIKDGGEVIGTQKKSVESQFADWFNASLNNN